MNLKHITDPAPMPGVGTARGYLKEAEICLGRGVHAWNRAQVMEAIEQVRRWLDRAEQEVEPSVTRE